MNKELLDSYAPISLAWLQAKSELMERKESKYLLHINQLERFLSSLQDQYEMLDINGVRIFKYENVYFDTQNHFFYHQHLQQHKSRTKIRTRKYVDSNLDFIEYKQKNNNVIKKERISIGEEQFWRTSPETIAFLESCFKKYYDKNKDFALQAILRNWYQRITLCHKTKKERVTIDLNISYYEVEKDAYSESTPKFSLPHLAIIECKHAEKKPYFTALMEKEFVPEIHLCSKYCLWAYYLGKTEQYKTFLPTIMYIEALNKNISLSRNFVQDYQQRITDNKREKELYQNSGNPIL